MKLRPWLILALLVLLRAPLLAAQIHPQPPSQFDDFASKASVAIEKSIAGLHGTQTLLVLDLDDQEQPPNELGSELAGELVVSFQTEAKGFVVERPADLGEPLLAQNIPQIAAVSSSILKCYMPALDVSFFLYGKMAVDGDTLVLNLDISTGKEEKKIFWDTLRIPLTTSMQDLRSTLAPSSKPFFTNGVRVWTNPDHPPVSNAIVLESEKERLGYNFPHCLKCDGPDYSDQAVRAQVGGTIRLLVQILPDGSLSKISITQGLPCGLTDKAFEAVEHWEFAPATGPDGAPIAAEVPIEITFRLY